MKHFIGLIVGVVAMRGALGYAASPGVYPDDFVVHFGTKLNTSEIDSTHQLVSTFCTQAYDGGARYDAQETRYYYDPSQSLFLMVLCQQDKIASSFLHHADLTQFGVKCDGFTQDGDNCEKPLYTAVDHIYNYIVSDIFDSMTAQAYGYNSYTQVGSGSTEELKKMSYSFLAKYGTQRLESACNRDKSDECIIPDTIDYLDSYIQQARNLTQQLKRLKSNLEDVSETTALCETQHKKEGTYTLLLCGLGVESETTAMRTEWHNLIANEQLWYTTFAQYYAHQLSTNSGLQPSQQVSGIQRILGLGDSYAASLEARYSSAMSATHDSLMQINQIYSTFPTHIHLLAQYEMTKKVRARLADIYTPLHQLYYKLRNVQAQG